jgi:hypothetical protein
MQRSSGRGQATVGYALVVAIALLGTVTIVALGATALTDIQTSSGTGAAEQAMTQFDSKTSQVALGDSETQTVSVGRTDGSYEVDPDAGYVKVVHANFAGPGATGGDADLVSDSATDDDEVIYESTLGAVQYERGDTVVGYQSGGVWKQIADGPSRMVSPPEFHYRGSTLTFPIIRVNQNSGGVESGSGSVDLRTTQDGDPVDVYPTRADGYPSIDSDSDGHSGPSQPYGGVAGGDDGDGDGGHFENPATNGTVVIYIESEFYEAWATYFEERTDGVVDTSDTAGGLAPMDADPQGDGPDDEGVVAVKLVSTGFTGGFTMPGDGASLNLRGIDNHTMTRFDITLAPDQTDSANFNNLQWSMYVEDGSKEFEMHLRKAPGGGGSCSNQVFEMTIYYSPAGKDNYHGWKNTSIEPDCNDIDGDGDIETRLHVDFVDDDNSGGGVSEADDSAENDMKLEYTSLSQSDLTHFSPDSLIGTATFDEHTTGTDPDPDWESSSPTYSSGDEEHIDGLVNHYFSLLGPGFDLTVDDKDSNTVTESASSGEIEYTGGSQFVTFIHISENDVQVEVN